MKKCKVYSDGSHYIAIRPTEGYSGPRRKPPPEEPIIVEEEAAPSDVQNAVAEECVAPREQEQACGDMPEQTQPEAAKERHISTRADEFLKWYRESYGKKKKEQYAFIASKLAPYFESDEALHKYLDHKMECKKRAEVTRRIRCLRRAALHELSYFATFTYDDKKATEKEFEKRLLTALSNLASRKGWKYMGTWERGGDTDRLHFHAILYIPDGKMVGKLELKRDYDVKKKRMVERMENSFKYIEKSGGRIICSKGLRTFIETDIDNDDVVAQLREDDDKKYLLFDDFKVYKDGKELGAVTPGVLAQAKTVN